MRELLLLRHGEAQPATRGMDDAQRPLSVHGESQARAAGMWLDEQSLWPHAVLCSHARRTRQTAALALAASTPPPITYRDSILGAMPGQLLALLEQHDHGDRLLLIGHNPGLSHLLVTLCTNALPHMVMSPACIAHIRLDGSLEPGRGQLLAWKPG